MKLLFKQRLFSWFDSYDIFTEDGQTLYTVQGQLAWGHCLKIYDAAGQEIATVKQRVLSFLPTFEFYLGEDYLGCMSKELSLFKPRYNIDFNGWFVEGDIFEWEYQILDPSGGLVALVSKEIWNWTDTYTLDIPFSENALSALMLVLAIDAEKCSRDN